MEKRRTKAPAFRREIEEISCDDLDELKLLEEGWFVEFKKHLPESNKIAKSISSFANAYGGLLIIGVEEDSKTRRFLNYCHLNLVAADEAKTKIRQAVEAHLQPCPIFFTKSINISHSESKDEWIIIVKVPKSIQAPHLHSSGVIYTRKGDSASPVALTDLGLLDRLWSEKEKKQKSLENRINFLCSQAPRNIPKIEIIIASEKTHPNNHKTISFSEFQKIALHPHLDGAPPIFNNSYPLDSSYIARHSSGAPNVSSIIWDFDYSRNLHYIYIPLGTQKWKNGNFDASLIGSQELDVLNSYLNTQYKNQESIFITDITFALVVMNLIFSKIGDLYKDEKSRTKLFINARASGVKNSVILVNLPRYNENITKFGLPFIHREVDFIYPIEKIEAWYKIEQEAGEEETPEVNIFNIVICFSIFVLIAESLGISNSTMLGRERSELNCDEAISEITDTITKLTNGNISYSSAENPSI